MSSSATKEIAAGAAGLCGVGAFVLPLATPWSVALLLVVSAACILVTSRRPVMLTLCGVGVAAVILGMASLPFVVSVLAAVTLAAASKQTLALSVLALELSSLASATELLGGQLGVFRIAAPSLLSLACLLPSVGSVRGILAGGACALLTMSLAWLCVGFAVPPSASCTLVAAPLLTYSYWIAIRQSTAERLRIVSVLFLASAMLWIATPPRNTKDIWVIVPTSPDVVEAKYFRNYIDALKFSGVDAKSTNNPSKIPQRATVIAPWLTEEIGSEGAIKGLAESRAWTVVLAGEHTNMGGVADRILRISGKKMLASDLTVPPENGDYSGQLRGPDARQWPARSILNRGASASVSSISDRVLLAGDNWWAEPDIGEWLWVGDYLWRGDERAGRIPLAVSSDSRHARWVVVGDNSPLLNSQIIADPRPLRRLLEYSTLWPAFAHDAGIMLIAGLLLASPAAAAVGGIALLCLVAAAQLTSNSFKGPWRDTYLHQSGFDAKNFNVALAEQPRLWKGRRLIRFADPQTGRMTLPDNDSTAFMLVKDRVSLGDVEISDCHRIGSLPSEEGPMIMDGQACAIKGQAEVLLGNHEAAAAIRVHQRSGTSIIIFDQRFLSEGAPPKNSEWLVEQYFRRKAKSEDARISAQPRGTP